MNGALRGALATLHPGRADTLLLRACLADGDDCRSAWSAFTGDGRDLVQLFRTDRGELKRLGPLLGWNLQRNQAPVDARLMTVLRTGALREELRSRIYDDVVAEVAGVIGVADASAMLVGGAALATWAWRPAALRHSHDIDLLASEDGLDAIGAALRDRGFAETVPAREASVHAAAGRVLELTHPTSLPVRIRTSLFDLSCHPADFTDLRSAARALEGHGWSAPGLSAADSLALAVGAACFSPRRLNLQWAADAWMIARSGEPVDPDRLVATLSRARLILPAATLFQYLRETGAPLETTLVDAVSRAAARPSRMERDVALHGVRRATPGGVGTTLASMTGVGARAVALWWMLCPSPEYVRWSQGARHAGPLACLRRTARLVGSAVPRGQARPANS